VGTTKNYGCLDANLSLASVSSKTVSHGIQVPENHRVDGDLPRKQPQKCSHVDAGYMPETPFREKFEQAWKRYEREVLGFWLSLATSPMKKSHFPSVVLLALADGIILVVSLSSFAVLMNRWNACWGNGAARLHVDAYQGIRGGITVIRSQAGSTAAAV
jgi:hypothetical protein